MSIALDLMGSVDRAIPPDVLRAYLRRQQGYNLYRERAGAGIQVGFDEWERYLRYRPYIFAGSAVGCIGSLVMLYLRYKRGPEAVSLWLTSATINGAVAWFTRATPTIRNAEAAAKEMPVADDGTPPAVLAYLDAKAAEYKKTDPNFPDSTFKRLANLPGMKEQYDTLPELAKAAIV